jgi:hypothetical protein
MHGLDEEITTAFQATSLILVFVTVLFGIRYERIRTDIRKPVPPGPEDRRDHRRWLFRSLVANCGPLLLVNGLSCWLFAPLLLRVLKQSRFAVWDFDFARTSFVLISLFVAVFFAWSCVLTIQMARRIMATLREDDVA